MRWLPTKQLSPIGLDLGSHSFKAVQLKRSAGGWTVAASVSLPRLNPAAPLEAAEVGRLQSVLARRGFVGNDAVISVPNASLLTSMLELPARAPGVPLEQIAAAEFSRLHRADALELSMAIWELPQSSRASKATYMLAAGAKSDVLEAHLDIVEANGLDVIAIEEPHSAGARACLSLDTATDGLTAVVDLGWDAVRLVILNSGTVVYTRKLSDAGLMTLCKDAMESVAASAEDVQYDIWHVGLDAAAPSRDGLGDVRHIVGSHLSALLKEIGQAFGYAGHQYPDSSMAKVVLIGGGAVIPGIEKRFEDALEVPAFQAARCSMNVKVGLPSADLASAMGLALWTEAGR